MKEVTIHEAKTHLSALIRSVEAGETIVVKRGNVAVARLVPMDTPHKERPLGQWRGKITIADDFDAPLPPELAIYFE
ncbi:MAG: type II toxin-antitoxin system Phd/YefM family antitoxin [Candidatus Eremiobacteraeota bacterium]|nr:type II toxin-antitoxin system Phd/YefM family antitoxin [Candidatus Eremiobacteraeota bacterium]MCW5868330.1 type II toxin-antitoxin system Phd/YefM family antitoxin [Candidatus Eremiobacteraeota bacterium]